MKKILPILLILGAVYFLDLHLVYAQNDLTVAVTKNISDQEAVVGDIVSLQADGSTLKRSTVSFDTGIVGIIVDKAVVVYHPKEGEGVPIASSGEALVNVTTLGGPISTGDLITSSSIAGKGQKATNNEGWILGTAVGSLSETEGEPISFEERQLRQGQVLVRLRIGTDRDTSAGVLTKLVDQLGYVLLKNVETPTQSDRFFRYLIAALVAIAAIAIGFGSFGKNITRGIEAIGRNPLAKRQIQAMIVLNLFLIGLISFAGIFIALVIIRQ